MKKQKKGKISRVSLSPWEIIQIVEDLLDGHPGGQSTWPGSLKPDFEDLVACLEEVIFLTKSLSKSSIWEPSSLRPDFEDLVACLEVVIFLLDSL